jgi:hypothetical protein
MATSRRFNLTHNAKTNQWELRNARTNRLVKSFGSKKEATKRGVLEKCLGRAGGSVQIRTKGGVLDEERRYD